MKQAIYNKISEYYINTFIDPNDKPLLYNLAIEHLKDVDKKIIKVIYIWDIIWNNDDLRLKYNKIFNDYPIKIKKNINKNYVYLKKDLIKLLIDFNIETDYETKELLLNYLYLAVDILIKKIVDDNTINLYIEHTLKNLIGLNFNNLCFANKYSAYQRILLIVILIELYNKKVNKINIVQMMNFIDTLDNIVLKDFLISLVNYNNN